MSGLVKQKQYDWKDSNLALFGSDLEKNIKKHSAEFEKAWTGAGLAPGLKIWRIEKFKVVDWPAADYGKFFSGDSYIILHTYKPSPTSEALAWDVHFWIGKYSTQDEYGTAAYKTVELDHFLNDGPVQHREVQDYESKLFKSYFSQIYVMEGGCDSGFRKVKPKEYKPRLLHFSGGRKLVEVREVPCRVKSLKSDDVFILDLGLQIYQWNGKNANKDERFKAAQFCQQLEGERGGAHSDVVDEEAISESHAFYEKLAIDIGDVTEDGTPITHAAQNQPKRLFKLSDESGALQFQLVKEGNFSQDNLDPKDVFIIDAVKEIIVWIGNGASAGEKQNGLVYAHNYSQKGANPLAPVSVLSQGQRSEYLAKVLA